MILTLDMIARASKSKRPNPQNVNSFLVAYHSYGMKIGLDKPHRTAHLLAQLMHESSEFRYDREIWGPTPAQKRYDIRTDLGNSPERDGDGYLYRGRTPIQITGKSNYHQFYMWCRSIVTDRPVPDFVKEPDLVNTDPFEGLGPFWYWDTRKLNTYADKNNIEMITRRINGGINGLSDRIEYYERVAMVLLDIHSVVDFQRQNGLKGDGIVGPETRAAMHHRLVLLESKVPPTLRPVPKPRPTPQAEGPTWIARLCTAILNAIKEWLKR